MKKLFNFAKEKDIDGPFRTEYLVSLAFNYRVMEVAASVTHFFTAAHQRANTQLLPVFSLPDTP